MTTNDNATVVNLGTNTSTTLEREIRKYGVRLIAERSGIDKKTLSEFLNNASGPRLSKEQVAALFDALRGVNQIEQGVINLLAGCHLQLLGAE